MRQECDKALGWEGGVRRLYDLIWRGKYFRRYAKPFFIWDTCPTFAGFSKRPGVSPSVMPASSAAGSDSWCHSIGGPKEHRRKDSTIAGIADRSFDLQKMNGLMSLASFGPSQLTRLDDSSCFYGLIVAKPMPFANPSV